MKGTGEQNKLPSQPWHLLAGDVSLPAAVIYQSRLENNLQWMQTFAEQQGVKLAPHGKTTMVPAFFKKQIDAGAWGISLATATQVMVASDHGIKRILMANQIIGKRNMEIIAGLLDKTDFYCLVDAVENIHQLGNFFRSVNKTLNVLIEVGVEKGRCGCRDEQQVLELVHTIAKYDCLKLKGIEFYEGIIHGDSAEDKINIFLDWVVSLIAQLISLDAFDTEQAILTGSGSAWYDLVSDHFYRASLSYNILPVIRPGCYLIHDEGIYQDAQKQVIRRIEKNGKHIEGGLQSCLEIWAYVQSMPETGMAIVGMGKRDVAFTDGLPRPVLHYRFGNVAPTTACPSWQTTHMMDQHTYISIPENPDLRIGDIIAFSTSHPCLSFDKWKYICITDDDYKVVDCVKTYF